LLFIILLGLRDRFVSCLMTDEFCEGMLGIRREQFLETLREVEEELVNTKLGSHNEPKIQKLVYGGRQRELKAEVQLMMFYLWLRHNPVDFFMGILFEISNTRVMAYNAATLLRRKEQRVLLGLNSIGLLSLSMVVNKKFASL